MGVGWVENFWNNLFISDYSFLLFDFCRFYVVIPWLGIEPGPLEASTLPPCYRGGDSDLFTTVFHLNLKIIPQETCRH